MSTNTQIGKYNYCRITRTINGKKKQFYGTSKRDCERKYKEFMERQKEKVVAKATISFGESIDFYVKNILRNNSKYSVGTRNLYEESYNRNLKDKNITKIQLSSLGSEDVQSFYNSLQISHSAITTLDKFLKGYFKWAELTKNCENIMSSVVLPERPKNRRDESILVWTDEELEKILSIKEYYLHDLLVFAAYSGLRISELLGLRWMDLDENIIHVRQQYYRGSFISPKNGKERMVPMHEKIREIVNNADPLRSSHDLVFTTSLGTPLDYHNVNTSLRRFYRRINLDPKKFHAYRATFITNLCRNGVPIQTVSKLAGHSNINVTAKYYTAISLDELSNAIDSI